MNQFINQALIFIASSLLLVPIIQYLGLGSILGYLIAGVVIGPQVLHFIQDPTYVVHVADLGVVLLLFMIGLEIQPRSLWSMRKSILSLGILQVLICTLIFSALAMLTGLPVVTACTIGFALSLSSTAFAIQTLDEKNQLKTEFGRSSFAVLLTQDLFAIPALALIPAVASRSAAESGLELSSLGLFIALIAALVLIGRYVMHPIFRLTARTHNREVFMALTLFIVFGVSYLMLQIGLSAALGTFIAGVLLADSEYRHELEANLDPFKSIFMGLFFISVGLGLSIELILQKPFLLLLLTLLYLSLKMILIYMVGRFSRLGHENSKLMSLNLAQGGEFAFVILGMANFIPRDVQNHLTAIITISIALNPLLIFINDQLTTRYPKTAEEKKYDVMPDESPQVIIAGFGRFGQSFGRILKLQRIPYVAIDHDADQIELVRKFGSKVYYGDINRLELLESAGAAKAKYFILAIDDIEQSLKAARLLVDHFPNLKIFARARNRGHYFELKSLGINFIKREVFDSSVAFVGDLLREMGQPPQHVAMLIQKFIEHDEILMQEQYKVRTDDDSYISTYEQGHAQLEEILAKEEQATYIKT